MTRYSPVPPPPWEGPADSYVRAESIVEADSDAGGPVTAGCLALRMVVPQGSSCRSEPIQVCLEDGACKLLQFRHLGGGDREQSPVLRIFSIPPIDRLRKYVDKLLPTAWA